MTNSTSTGVTAKRIALVLAWIGLALTLNAAAAVVRLFPLSSAGPGPYYFMGLPVAFAMVAIAASRGRSVGPMWTAIGAMAGVVIVGAWSIGAFFAPAALALLVAGLAQLVAVKSRWRTLTAPLWALVGLFAIPVIFR